MEGQAAADRRANPHPSRERGKTHQAEGPGRPIIGRAVLGSLCYGGRDARPAPRRASRPLPHPAHIHRHRPSDGDCGHQLPADRQGLPRGWGLLCGGPREPGRHSRANRGSLPAGGLRPDRRRLHCGGHPRVGLGLPAVRAASTRAVDCSGDPCNRTEPQGREGVWDGIRPPNLCLPRLDPRADRDRYLSPGNRRHPVSA